MNQQLMPNKYYPGDVVSAKVDPDLKLVVRRYIDRIYYCQIQNDLKRKDLVYFERELVENPLLLSKNNKV